MSPRRPTALAAGALPALVLLALPFAGLVLATPWHHLALARGDVGAATTSAIYCSLAMLIVVVAGTPLAYWLARARFRGKWLADGLVLLPLLTPPLAMGLLLATFYGPHSWAGASLDQLGLNLTNTPAAFVMAQVYAAAPYYIVAARAAFENVPDEYEQVARTLGRGPAYCFVHITLPLAALGLAAGVALGWVRAMGEFGIVMIIAYFPQGIPVKLWTNLQDAGLSSVYPLLWLFFVVAMPLPLLLGLWSRRLR